MKILVWLNFSKVFESANRNGVNPSDCGKEASSLLTKVAFYLSVLAGQKTTGNGSVLGSRVQFFLQHATEWF